MLQIEVQWPGKSLGEARDYCERFGCTVEKTRHKDYFKVMTDDPTNFYWLGANINNSVLNELMPSAVSKYTEL